MSLLKSSLLKRYILLFIAVFSVMGFSYLTLSFGLANYYLDQVQTRVHYKVADTLIQDHQIIQEGRVNEQALASTFERYMLLNPYLEIYLLNHQGDVLHYSADEKKIKRHNVNIDPIEIFLSSSPLTHFPLGDNPRSLTEKSPFSVARLPGGDYLYVIIQNSIEQESNRQLQESILFELSIWSFITSLLLGFILGGALFYHLSLRIHKLQKSIAQFAKDPEKASQIIAPPISEKDELDNLHEQVAQMSVQIQKQIQQLKKTDTQRRFMISSLSHDLRTPLTNLLGFMEHAECSKDTEHLKIAYQNGLKLKHYLNQLFDFSKLDLESFKLHKQELSLSEFCDDLLQTYRQNHPEQYMKFYAQKNIVLSFDANLMERAIANLLDNAIQYGSGQILLQLEEQGEYINIYVCDQGLPLSESFQQQDFTPFSKNTSQQKSNSGLGLSIVKAISVKHNGDLSYQRKEHKNCFNIQIKRTTA